MAILVARASYQDALNSTRTCGPKVVSVHKGTLTRCLLSAVCISHGQGTKWQCYGQMTVHGIFQACTKEVTNHMCTSLTICSETDQQ